VKGMKIWRGFGANYKSDNSAKPIPFSLDLSSDLLTASYFSVDFAFDILNDSSNCNNITGTCRECADLALDVCGAGKVGSVKCPKDGSCEFSCK
jgi:hypothetical protein